MLCKGELQQSGRDDTRRDLVSARFSCPSDAACPQTTVTEFDNMFVLDAFYRLCSNADDCFPTHIHCAAAYLGSSNSDRDAPRRALSSTADEAHLGAHILCLI